MSNMHLKVAAIIATLSLTACSDRASSSSQASNSLEYQSHFIDANISRNLGNGRELVRSENFRRADYEGGISIDVPTGWFILNQNLTEAVGRQAGVAFDAMDMERGEGQATYLLKANATPTKAVAILSLTRSQPPSALPHEIEALSPRDFLEMDSEFRAMFEKMLRLQGGGLIKWHGAHLEHFDVHPAIVTEYERKSLLGPGTFIVQVNQIFTPTQEIRLTMSYDTSVGMVYMPVLTRVRKSLSINN